MCTKPNALSSLIYAFIHNASLQLKTAITRTEVSLRLASHNIITLNKLLSAHPLFSATTQPL